MKFIAKENDLEYGKDVKLLTVGNSTDFTTYLSKNMNTTKYGVVFCLGSMMFMNVEIKCSFEFLQKEFNLYTILYNITNSPNGFLTGGTRPWPKHPELNKLKIDLDNAYLNYYGLDRKLSLIPHISAELQDYPTTSNRFVQNADIVSAYGAFYFYFPPVISFVVMLLEIIREKDLKLRKVKFILNYRV